MVIVFLAFLCQSLHWDQCMLEGKATWQCRISRRQHHKTDYYRVRCCNSYRHKLVGRDAFHDGKDS